MACAVPATASPPAAASASRRVGGVGGDIRVSPDLLTPKPQDERSDSWGFGPRRIAALICGLGTHACFLFPSAPKHSTILPSTRRGTFMLTIRDSGTTLCDYLTRRDWLRIGALGSLGLSLPTLLAARAHAA